MPDTSAGTDDAETFARGLDIAAQRLEQLGRPASKLAILDRICRDHDHWPYQKQRLTTALALRAFDTAEAILDEIDRKAVVDPAEEAWLDARRKQVSNRPIVVSRLLTELAVKNPPQYQPVTGRILYVLHNSLPYSSGGYATRGHGLLQGMRQIGYDMVCVTRPGFPTDIIEIEPEDVAPIDEVDGIQYHRITSPSYKIAIGHGYILSAAERMEEKLRELRPELVIAASNHVTGLPAQIAAKRQGIPFIYEVRGFWEITRASREPRYLQTKAYAGQAKLETICADAADHVFTLTGGMREELIRRGVSGAKVTLLPNSCLPEQFLPQPRDRQLAEALNIPEDVPVIGYIGSFVQYEGLDDLARAAAILKGRGVEFRLLLVGNENVSRQEKGPITAMIEAVATESGLADWLIMPGRVPHDQVAMYYSLIEIAPFPRKPQLVTEMVSPMKPLEAMAMQKAVAASSVAALAEMIRDGETGLIFEKGNPGALADVLQRLIEDPELREKLGRNGRTWVETERSWPQTAVLAQNEITRVLASRAKMHAA